MAKKKQKGSLSIWLPVIGILILSLSLVSINTASQNVLGVTVSQGKQLQIDWFRPIIRPSSSPGSSVTASSVPRTSAIPQVSPSISTQPSPSVPSGNDCNHSNGLLADPAHPFNPTCDCPAIMQTCVNGAPSYYYVQNPSYTYRPSNYTTVLFCQQRSQSGIYCFDKPVIYLYPPQKTLVDVKVTIKDGWVTVSDPLYDEKFKGWNGVTAYPDGTLYYQGEKYHELFYETATTKVQAPIKGFVVPKEKLLEELTQFTSKLGLIGSEQVEFLDYWIPELKALEAPYIFISLIDKDQKDQIDHVTISPKPDVFINFLVYFRPLSQPIIVEPLILPTAPKRVGFTAVEWGGTIDTN